MKEMKDSGIEWIGEIPSHWKITKCKYISKFINGFAFDSKDQTYVLYNMNQHVLSHLLLPVGNMEKSEIRKYAEKAGIKAEINAQTLRNSFAVHMLQNGADISIVSEMLGHGDVVTTRVYSKVVNDNIKKMYRKAHPRA